MARVSVAESKKIIEARKGFSVFKFQPGKQYQILFLGDSDDNEIMYLNPVHTVLGASGKRGQHRCVQDYIVHDESGKELAYDATSGLPVNDGSCPFCELNRLFFEQLNAKVDAFKQEHGLEDGAKEVIDFYKKQVQKNPSSRVDMIRAFLVAVFELNESGRPVRDDKGNLVYQITALKMTPNQFDKKFEPQVKTVRASYDEGDTRNGIVWAEYTFSYPASDKQGDQAVMESAKDMTIAPALKAVLTDELKATLSEEVSKLDLDGLEEKLRFFKAQSLTRINQLIAPQMSKVRANMSDEEKEAVNEELAENMQSISAEEAQNLLDDEEDALLDDSGADKSSETTGNETDIDGLLDD